MFEKADARGVRADHLERIEIILSILNVAQTIESLSLPSFRLHPLKGNMKGRWAVTVRANWRIVFRFEDGDAFDVDLVDYH